MDSIYFTTAKQGQHCALRQSFHSGYLYDNKNYKALTSVRVHSMMDAKKEKNPVILPVKTTSC